MPLVNPPSQEEFKEEVTKLASLTEVDRGEAMSGLKAQAKAKVLRILVETALLNGLNRIEDIQRWIGTKVITYAQTIKYKDEIIDTWLDESVSPDTQIKTERQRLIQAAWKIVRECEIYLQENELEPKDFVSIKRTQLEAHTRIAKLTGVEKAAEEDSTKNLQINLFGGNKRFEEPRDAIDGEISAVDSESN